MGFFVSFDSRSCFVHGDRAHSTLVTQHLDEGLFLTGRPEGDCAVGVPEMDDSVGGVLAHHVQAALLGAYGGDLFSHRYIKILQETRHALKQKK